MKKKNGTNYQDLLKVIATVIMVLDHLALYMFPKYEILRVIGRYSMPVFFFFVGYNFHGRLSFKILSYGLILYFFDVFIIWKQIIEINALLAIFLAQVYLFYFADKLTNFYKAYIHVVILACLTPVFYPYIEYGMLTPAIAILGFITKTKQTSKNLSIFIVCVLSLLYSYFCFGFDCRDFVLAVFVICIYYVSMVAKEFESTIPVNLKLISRNTAIIYVVHLVLIQTYWRYYIVIYS